MDKAVSTFSVGFGTWVRRDSNMPKKDIIEESIEGPGKTLPKDKLDVIARKLYVLCEYPKG